MRISLILILFIAISVNAAPRSTKNEAQKYKYTVFGYSFTIPGWMERFKNKIVGPDGIFTKMKAFVTGDTSVSTNIFGEKVAFRAHLPKNQKEVAKSVTQFFTKVRDDHTTRIIFVIYLNIVVMFIVYSLLFVKQMQLAKEHKRQRNMTKRHRKLEEADRKDFIARAAVIQETEMAHADILRKRAGESSLYDEEVNNIEQQYPGLSGKMEQESAKSKIANSPLSTSSGVANQSITVLSTSGSRLLGPDLFSPTVVSDGEMVLNASNLYPETGLHTPIGNASAPPFFSPSNEDDDISSY